MGGVGKTPHIEYLVRLLINDYNIATLSRGYKRSTTGFFLSDKNSTVSDIGDEPLQYKLKFKNINVAVDEKRVNGINKIKEYCPETNVVLLDDAYQHRAVNPGCNILITDANRLYVNDNVVPSGRLREWACGSERADIIIVSKTSNVMPTVEKKRIVNILKPKTHQKVYFSYIKYGVITPFTNTAYDIANKIVKNYSVLLLTGIAKAGPLFYKLKSEYNSIEHIKYSDHHNYTNTDVTEIKERYKNLYGNNKIIISTEKDIMRLSLPKIKNQLNDIPIFYIPIEICFHGSDKDEFNTQILKYVRENSRD